MTRLLACVGIALLSAAYGNEPADRAASSAALSWLLARRPPDGGWGADTARVVTALNLASGGALSAAQRQLAVSQLQIELLADIWRRRQHPLTSCRLAEYILALVTSCVGVHNFQGKDLTALMYHHQHHHHGSDYEEAPVVLAACVAGGRVRRSSLHRLLTATNSSLQSTSSGALAFSVSALRCVADHGDRRVRLQLEAATQRLAARQRPDGSFGDLGNTLMAVQALRMQEVVGWDEAGALSSILAHRGADGSFGNVALTAIAAWVLAGRSLLDATNTDCHQPATTVPDFSSYEKEYSKSTASSIELQKNSRLFSPPQQRKDVTLWLWIGADVRQAYSFRLSAPKDATLFDCMRLAADRDPHFQFSAELWPNGHYIHTIDGHRERKDGYRFWLLYDLTGPPDRDNRPTHRDLQSTGVDHLVPADGAHLLFWYTEL